LPEPAKPAVNPYRFNGPSTNPNFAKFVDAKASDAYSGAVPERPAGFRTAGFDPTAWDESKARKYDKYGKPRM